MATSKTRLIMAEMDICVAIDISGSTIGPPLEAEIDAVRDLLCLRDVASKSKISVLPWTVSPYSLIALPDEMDKLEDLQPDSGTAPSCLFKSNDYVKALKACGLWFLLTDGGIDEKELCVFTREMMNHGIHSKACVIVFFGSKKNYKLPGNVDVSTGASVYALASESLFLFHDVDSGEVYILQAKGCFKKLLGTRAQPIFTPYLTWSHLPTMSYSSLRSVVFPVPKKRDLLEAGLISLGHDMSYHPGDLLDNSLGPSILDVVLSPSNLRSLAIIGASLGCNDEFSSWIKLQLKPVPPISLLVEKSDPDNQAKRTIAAVLELLQTSSKGIELQQAQACLRAAHQENWERYRTALIHQDEQQALIRERNSLFLVTQRQIRALSVAMAAHPTRENPIRNILPASIVFPSEIPYYAATPLSTDNTSTYIRGFNCTPSSNLIGLCPICDRSGSLMTMLFKRVPTDIFNFHSDAARDPFATGEKTAHVLLQSGIGIRDLISSTICCDMCAYYIVRDAPRTGPESFGRVIEAVPCVSFAPEKRGNGQRLNEMALLAVLENATAFMVPRMETKGFWVTVLRNGVSAKMEGEMETYRQVLAWFCRELEESIEVDLGVAVGAKVGTGKGRAAVGMGGMNKSGLRSGAAVVNGVDALAS